MPGVLCARLCARVCACAVPPPSPPLSVGSGWPPDNYSHPVVYPPYQPQDWRNLYKGHACYTPGGGEGEEGGGVLVGGVHELHHCHVRSGHMDAGG